MKPALKKTFSKSEAQVLHHFIYGLAEQEIANEMGLSLVTIQDIRRSLFHKFDCSNVLEMCKRAIQYGYALEFTESIGKLRQQTCYDHLFMWEILILHELFDGKSLKEAELIIDQGEDFFRQRLEIMKLKLRIEDINQLCFPAIVSGYIDLEQVSVDTLSKEFVNNELGNWMNSGGVLKIPQYSFEKKFKLMAKSVNKHK